MHHAIPRDGKNVAVNGISEQGAEDGNAKSPGNIAHQRKDGGRLPYLVLWNNDSNKISSLRHAKAQAKRHDHER